MRVGTGVGTWAALLTLLSAALVLPSAAYAGTGEGVPADAVRSRAVASAVDGTCSGSSVNTAATHARQVDLVLDDSGSMFYENGEVQQRWSHAKYSLEVFAAMLGADDTLNVYRMSDFADGGGSGPTITVTGAQSAGERVQRVHEMEMLGGSTPYAPVKTAIADLKRSDAPEKWLVILSDGEFDDPEHSDRTYDDALVQRDLRAFAKDESSRVAFLAIGPKAPRLKDDPAAGVHFEHAEQSDDLLDLMTGFANRIFARSVLESIGDGRYAPDADLDQVLVFAQGRDLDDVQLQPAGAAKPRVDGNVIQVRWSDNPPVFTANELRDAEPDRSLSGILKTYDDVRAGPMVVDAEGDTKIDVFYTPRAVFGIKLYDDEMHEVDSAKVPAGDYTVEFGFMDRDCDFVESELFGTIDYTAQLTHDGEPQAGQLKKKASVTLERGHAVFDISATYLNGSRAEATIDLTVLRPAQKTRFEPEDKTFRLSGLADYAMPADAMRLHYGIDRDGALVDFTPEEWEAVTDETLSAETDADDIGFEIRKGDAVGEVLLLPKAPGDEPLEAAHGDIPVTVHESHVYDEQENTGEITLTVTIEDDIPLLEHLWYWFLLHGWKWLLLLLALIWILGYFVRPTFSRRIKPRPTITYKPKSRGKRSQLSGKFEKNRLSALIPYKARTATLVYAARGFSAMKLKAARGGRIEIQNWKQIAQRGNVRINGEVLDKDTAKPPLLRPAHSITAIGPDGAYDMTLNA